MALLLLSGFTSCGAQSNSGFYEGLKTRAAGIAERTKALSHFEAALNSRNAYIRSAAANELLDLQSEGALLSPALVRTARREASGSWAAVFEALDGTEGRATKGRTTEGPSREKALAFILSGPANPAGGGNSTGVFPDDAALYLLRECRKRDSTVDTAPITFFSEAENAAIDGHIAASRSRFRDALRLFRTAFADGPQLFFQHPALLNDLGRAFQYASQDSEGINLLLEWENSFSAASDENTIRFRLLFFAARIARQRGLTEQAIELFTQALPFAPDASQSDACIWYILDSALKSSPAVVIRRIETHIPQWHDPAYFSDILDKLSRELASRRQWSDLIRLFSIIYGQGDAASTAKYAWIIGRALEEQLLPPEETRMAADALAAIQTGGASAESAARSWLRIAYNTVDPAGNTASFFSSGGVSFYYRSVSAVLLTEPFLKIPEPAVSGGGHAGSPKKPSPLMEFLLGFFSSGSAAFAPRYIRLYEAELSPAELRRLAEALDKAELYTDSMRLVSAYMGREGYLLERRDLELQYPRPFKNPVEQYAKETGVSPAILYGLIRTESAFQSSIVSRAGAVGLTQLIPSTAEEMADRIRRQGGPDYRRTDDGADTVSDKGTPTVDLRNPAVNIHIGAVYLAYLIERMESPLLALLSYNGGMNRIRRWRETANRSAARSQSTPFPVDLFLETIEYDETREYGRKVLAAAAVYEELYYKGEWGIGNRE